jgi:hypothetical protein
MAVAAGKEALPAGTVESVSPARHPRPAAPSRQSAWTHMRMTTPQHFRALAGIAGPGP